MSDGELEELRTGTRQITKQLAGKIMPGFGNMGNTCFANSVLQCLGHSPFLVEYCMLGSHSKGCPSKSVAELDEIVIPIPTRYTGTKLS